MTQMRTGYGSNRPQLRTLQTVHIKEETGKEGGLAMVSRKNFEITTLGSGQNRTFEHITWHVQVNKKSLSITGTFHLPPKGRVINSMFIDDITDHLTSIVCTTQRNLILGHFNIHVDSIQHNDALPFSDTMMALGLNQCVNPNMHIHGNELYLVFTEAGSDITVSSHTQVYLFWIID